ncbi:MAG: beta/gamma crystallin-related protein [Micropepsaceae bacterium]
MRLATRILAAIAVVFASAGAAQAEYAPPGSYNRTCSDIETTWNTLSASCRTRNGSWNYTTLRNYRDCDGDIANRNGRLECVGRYNDDDDNGDDYGGWLPQGSYRNSCRNASIEGSTLTAECRDNFGRFRYTELPGYRSCRDIVNSNGMLRCRRDDYDDGDDDNSDGRLPGGSWRATCQNGRVYGGVLYATCRDNYGSWRASTVDLRNCRTNVVNENGRLVCGGSGGGGGGYSRITIYRHTNYAGRSRTFSNDVPDLSGYAFNNLTSSVVVQGGVWQLCDKPNYRGYCVIVDRSQSNLWAFGFNDRTESLRRIR